MKKILSLLIALLLVVSLFTACNNKDDTKINSSDITSESEDSEKTSPVPGVTSENLTAEDEDGKILPSEIIKADEHPNINSPAKLGEWVKAERFNKASEKNETIYWRVTSRTSDSKKDIDAYNNGQHLYQFDPLDGEELTYYVVSYEVYYPEEYTERESGILSYTLVINAVNPSGGAYEQDGIQYVGLGSGHDLEISAGEYFRAGEIYKGKGIYAMLVKEPTYVFDYVYEKDGEEIHSYVSLDPA